MVTKEEWELKKSERQEKLDSDRERANDIVKKAISNNRFFLGGSRRFGWARQQSDYDYFVYGNPLDVLDLLQYEFRKRGSFFKVTPGFDTYEEGFSQISIYGYIEYIYLFSDDSKVDIRQEAVKLIDINVTEHYSKFFELQVEHNTIESFIEFNPWLLRLLHPNVFLTTGKKKYRALRDIVKSKAIDPYYKLCSDCYNLLVSQEDE